MPGVLVQRSNVDAGRAKRAAEQRELAAAAVGLINQLDGFGIGHGNLLRMGRRRGNRVTGNQPARESRIDVGKAAMHPFYYRTSHYKQSDAAWSD
jgi:hypothetical protein